MPHEAPLLDGDIPAQPTTATDGTTDVVQLVRQARAQLSAGLTERATVALEAAAQRDLPPTERAEVLAALGHIRMLRDGLTAGGSLVQEALSLPEIAPLTRVRAELCLGIAVITQGDTTTGRGHGERALALAEEIGDVAGIVSALSMLAFLDLFQACGDPGAALARAHALLDELPDLREVDWHPALTQAIWEKYTGDLPAARRDLIGLRDILAATGSQTQLPFVLGHLAEAECWLGDWDAADRHALEAVELADRARLGVYRSLALFTQALVDAHRGNADQARARATTALEWAAERGVLTTVALVSLTLGFLEVSQGAYEPAAAVLEPLVAMVERSGAAAGGWAPFYVDAVEALLGAGQLARAAAVVAALQEWARSEQRWARLAATHAAGLLAAGSDQPDEAVAHLREAARLAELRELPFTAARALLGAGSTLRRARRRDAARPLLEDAHRRFVTLGAALWVRRAGDELGRLRPEPGREAHLTPAELRVAQLVREGRSNRDVATALCISPKAVEQHLTRIYRKLGLSSRSQLAALPQLPDS